MSVDGRIRWHTWEGCMNTRDLGGYPTVDGAVTRWGAVVRSGSLVSLTACGLAALLDSGLRTVIDLRSPGELADYPGPFASGSVRGVCFRNIALSDPGTPPWHPSSSQPGEPTTLADDYIARLERSPARIVAIMTAITRAAAGGVLIHCAAGKDRTGIISGLLLDVVGVAGEVIAEDYALSERVLWPNDAHWLEHGPGDRAGREKLFTWRSARAEVMLRVLAWLHDRHGGAVGYLQTSGISVPDVEWLRERLVARGEVPNPAGAG